MEKKSGKIGEYFKKYKVQILLFFAVFGVKVILNLFIKSMTLATGNDDIGTIASAAFFAGLDWSSVISQTLYYGWGYAMLMAPAFMLTDNVYVIIQIMLGYQAVLFAASIVIAYNILHLLWKIEDKKFCVLSALASNCFFFALVNTNILYNETAIIFLTWLIFYILLKIQIGMAEQKKVWGWTTGLVLCMSYGLTIHTRFIFVWGALFVLLLVYGLLKKQFLGTPWVMISGLIVGYVISDKLNGWMQDALWKANEQEGPLTNSMESVGGKLDNFLELGTDSGLIGFLQGCLGQSTIMYLLSGGLLAVFLVVLVVALKRVCQAIFSKTKTEDGQLLVEEEDVDTQLTTGIIFIGALLVATFLFTIINAVPVLKRAIERDWVSKWFVYSRYWGAACPMAMLLVFAWFKKCKDKVLEKRVWIASTIMMILWGTLFAIFIIPRLIGGKISSALVFQVLLGPTFNPYEARFSVVSFVLLLVFGGIWFVLMLVLAWKRQLAVAATVTMLCGVYIFGYKMIVADVHLAEACYEQYQDINTVLMQYGITPENYPRLYVDSELDDFYNAQLTLNRYQLIVKDYADYSVWKSENNAQYQDIEIALAADIGEEMCGYWHILYQKNTVNEEGVEEPEYYILVRTGALLEHLQSQKVKLQDIASIYNMEKLVYQSEEKKIQYVGVQKIGGTDVLEQDFYITSSMKKSDTFAFALMFKNPTLTPSDGKVVITISQGTVEKTYFVTMDNIVTREKFYVIVDSAAFKKGKATLRITCEEAQQFRYIIPYTVPFDTWVPPIEEDENAFEDFVEGGTLEDFFGEEAEEEESKEADELLEEELLEEEQKESESTKQKREDQYPLRFNGEEYEAEIYMQIFIPKSVSELHTAAVLHTEVSSNDAQLSLSPLEDGQVFSQRIRISKAMLKQRYVGMEFLVRNFNPNQDIGTITIKIIQDKKTKEFVVPTAELREKDYLRVVMKSNELSAGVTKVEISYQGEAGTGYPRFYSLKPKIAEAPAWILGRVYRDGKKSKHYLYMNIFGGLSSTSMEKYSW